MKLFTLIGAEWRLDIIIRKLKKRKQNKKANNLRKIEEPIKAQNITV